MLMKLVLIASFPLVLASHGLAAEKHKNPHGTFDLSQEDKRILLGDTQEKADDGPTIDIEFRDVNPAVETGICFNELPGGLRDLTCKDKDSLVKAFGAAAIVLKGMSFTCSVFPHPGAQVGAKIFDIAGYAMGATSFSYSLAKCVNPEEEMVKALKSACYELKKNGVNCVAVSK